MDLMLVGVELGQFSEGYDWNEFACVRELFYSLAEA